MSASLEKCFEGVSGMFAKHECAPVRSLARLRGAYPRVHQVEGDSLASEHRRAWPCGRVPRVFLPKNGCGDVPPRGAGSLRVMISSTSRNCPSESVTALTVSPVARAPGEPRPSSLLFVIDTLPNGEKHSYEQGEGLDSPFWGIKEGNILLFQLIIYIEKR